MIRIRSSFSLIGRRRRYRLVEMPGCRHQEMDGHYESFDAAWADALSWWAGRGGDPAVPCDLGVEVNTHRGQWRLLRQPCSAAIRGRSCSLALP